MYQLEPNSQSRNPINGEKKVTNFPVYKLTNIIPSNEAAISNLIKDKYIRIQAQERSKPLDFLSKLELIEKLFLDEFSIQDDLTLKLLAWEVLNLKEFGILLSDPQVSEIFGLHLDKPLVVNSFKNGKRITPFIFSEKLWSSIKLQAQLYSPQILNPLNPSLKVGLQTNFGNLRLTLNIEPLTPTGPTIIVRRLPQEPIQLHQLIQQNVIRIEVANKLISLIQERKNLIIVGEPGSGKTTLANALLLYCHPTWRIIVYEDASEVNIPPNVLPLASRITLPSIGNDSKYVQRTMELSKLLHRSPDYVFLGEIQTSEDTESVFESFAAGVRGLATTHGRNFESIINRWSQSHKLEKDLILGLDAILITKRVFEDKKFKIKVNDLFLKEGDWFEKF